MLILPPTICTISNEGQQEDAQKVWIINTPPEKSLKWAIMMSCLFDPSIFSVESPSLGLQNILDTLRVPLDSIRSSIIEFNPFHNRYFPDKNFHSLFDFLENMLNSYLKEENNSTPINLLQSVANVLKYPVHSYEFNYKHKIAKLITIYHPENLSEEGSEVTQRLTLFRMHRESYGFAISLTHALSLRKQAFNQLYVPNPKGKEIFKDLYKAIVLEDNFLLEAFRNCPDAMSNLYFPPSVAMKWTERGMNMDPLVTDEKGLSGFYYCLCANNIHLPRSLYKYATYNFNMVEINVRNPTTEILTALERIRQALENDSRISDNFSGLGDSKHEVQNLSRQFLRFNEYQCDVAREYIRIKHDSPDIDSQQIEIAISLLENYCKYFEFDIPSNASGDTILDNYTEFLEYYDKLDLFHCFKLYDQMVLLSKVVDVNKNMYYKGTVKCLFMFLLSHELYGEYEKSRPDKSRCNRFIILSYRNELKQHALYLMEDLKTCLREPLQFNHKQIDLLQESIASLPTAIKNLFYARKIAIFFDTLVKNINMDVSIFFLERILDLFGEILCQSGEKKECMFQHLLRCCLPQDIQDTLCKLRNHCFSKYRANAVQGRLNKENQTHDATLSLESEIRDLFYIVSPAFGSYLLEQIEEFLIDKGEKESKEKFDDVHKYMCDKKENMLSNRKTELTTNNRDYKVTLKNLQEYTCEILELGKSSNKKYFETLLYFMKYISLPFNFEYPELEDSCRRLQYILDNCKDETIAKAGKDILNEFKIFVLMYNKIPNNVTGVINNGDDFEKVKRYEGTLFSKSMYFMAIGTIFMTLASKWLKIIESTGESVPFEDIMKKEMSRKYLNAFSPVFEINEASIEELEKVLETFFEEISVSEQLELLYPKTELNSALKTFLSQQNTNRSHLKFENLHLLLNYIKEYDIFSEKDKWELKVEVTNYVRQKKEKVFDHLNRLNKKMEPLSKETDISPKKMKRIVKSQYKKDMGDLLKDVCTYPDRKKKIIDFLCTLKQNEAEECLEKCFREIEEIDLEGNGYQQLISKFEDKPHFRELFLKLNLQQDLENKVLLIINQKMYFLINRIDQLKKILIDNNIEVYALWLNYEINAIDQQLKVFMCERILKDLNTQTTLEVLYFDCLNVLYGYQNMNVICEKKTNLFAGINLRHFLAHGSPVVELACCWLDPEDILLELINNILKLIEDKPVLEALTELWLKVQTFRHEELEKIIENELEDEYSDLRKVIISCDIWKKYLKVLP